MQQHATHRLSLYSCMHIYRKVLSVCCMFDDLITKYWKSVTSQTWPHAFTSATSGAARCVPHFLPEEIQAHRSGVCGSRCGKCTGMWREGARAEILTSLPAEVRSRWIAGVESVQTWSLFMPKSQLSTFCPVPSTFFPLSSVPRACFSPAEGSENACLTLLWTINKRM